MKHATLSIAFSLAATAAAADINVRFFESAPKDRFEFENSGGCPITAADLTLDLGGSAADLIFDVTGAGAGVQVFQPFDVVAGSENLSGLPDVADGDTSLNLPISRLAPGDRIAFTIDVDDTINQRESMVSDAEITGASIRVILEGVTYSGVFAGDARATVPLPPCPTT